MGFRAAVLDEIFYFESVSLFQLFLYLYFLESFNNIKLFYIIVVFNHQSTLITIIYFFIYFFFISSILAGYPVQERIQAHCRGQR